MINTSRIAFLIFQVQIITISGALAPGPLTMATIGSGFKYGWKAGFYTAVGHVVVEFPLVMLIGLGIASILNNLLLQFILLFGGSSALFYFGYIQVRYSNKPLKAEFIHHHPTLIGAVFSLFNPYFIMWWLAVGGVLIYNWINLLGYTTLTLFYITHVWMDFAWLILLSYLASAGIKRLKSPIVKGLNIILGVILFVFGILFLHDASMILSNLL